jgi:DNA-binding NtrC family response regulator
LKGSTAVAKKQTIEQRTNWRVLIVDPQPAVRQVVGELFSGFYHVSLASSGEDALSRLEKQHIDLVLLDDRLPGEVDTRGVIRHTRSNHAELPVIVLSSEKEAESAVVGVGNCSFLAKSRIGTESGRAELLLLVERRLRDYRREREVRFQRRQSRRAGLTAEDFLVGGSRAIERIREQADEASRSNLSLLVTGETGVGKTLLAETVHYTSERGSTRPFVTVDPSIVAPSLFESELFGHARGAYTGATTAQIGAFEAAEGGTLLLDEIGDLRLDLQRKLLRAVEDRIIRRVGDVREIRLDLRIVAATHRDLDADVASGAFRADLFQRLNEQRIHIPALRERREDVVPLLVHFLSQLDPERTVRVSSSAERLLVEHAWPGNVRELRSVARRLNARGIGDEMTEADLLEILPGRIDRGAESDLSLEERIRAFSRRAYLDALRAHGFSVRGTARAIGLPYHTLRSRLASLGLLDSLKAQKANHTERRPR